MFLTMSWFWRGFQSAIFYYVSCTPCLKMSYRRKRRREYKRTKDEQALQEAEDGQYQHPSPFSTNPYWREEIDFGPGPPERKAVRDGRARTSKEKAPSGRKRLETGGSQETGTSSADTMVGTEESDQTLQSSEGWNKRRYQREDEMLWGFDDATATRSSVGMTSMQRSASGSSYQYYPRNPAINDLHPPVVSATPPTRAEARWMLQPPPKAKIMEGRERMNTPTPSGLSRSGSGGTNTSKSSFGTNFSSEKVLSKHISQRLMMDPISTKRAEQVVQTPGPVALSRVPSSSSAATMSTATQLGQNHDRDVSSAIICSNFKDPPNKQQALKHPNQPLPNSLPSTDPPLPSPPPQRPPLSTIPSASLAQSLNQNQNLDSEGDNKSPRALSPRIKSTKPPPFPTLLLSSPTSNSKTGSPSPSPDSLRVLQEIMAPRNHRQLDHGTATNNNKFLPSLQQGKGNNSQERRLEQDYLGSDSDSDSNASLSVNEADGRKENRIGVGARWSMEI